MRMVALAALALSASLALAAPAPLAKKGAKKKAVLPAPVRILAASEDGAVWVPLPAIANGPRIVVQVQMPMPVLVPVPPGP